MRRTGSFLLLVACAPDAASGSEAEASSTTDVPTTGSTSSTGSSEDEGASTDRSSSSSSDGSDEASGSTGAALGCAGLLDTDVTIEVDPEGRSTQIQASLTSDPAEEGVWVVYSVPAPESSFFDVHATRIGCDGEQQIAPRRINKSDGRNNIDGELARSGDSVLVVWASDDNTGGEGNLQILAQPLNVDGDPQLDEDVVIRTSYEGQPVIGSALAPHVVADGDAFALVGTRAIEEALAFQAFVQRLDATASLLGVAVAPPLEPSVTHRTADIAVLSSGEIGLAWAGTDTNDFTQIRYGFLNDTSFVTDPPVLLTPDGASAPALVPDATGERAYVAASVVAGGGRDIHVSWADATGEAPSVTLGGSGLNNVPALATSPTGAAVAWYRNIQGIDNELWVAAIVDDGETLTVEDEQVIPDVVAAIYPTTIAHVVDNVFVVAWSEGESPNFRLFARFIALG